MKYKDREDAGQEKVPQSVKDGGPKSSDRRRRQLAGMAYDEQVAAMAVPSAKPGQAGNAEKKKAKPHTKTEVEGLASDLAVDRFTDAAEDLERSWPEKDTVARAKTLGDAANVALDEASVPATGTIVRNLGVRSGEFDHEPWDLALAKETFEKDEIGAEEMSEVAGVVYHEARHAEQWHKMMRLEAGRGVGAKELAETYAVKKEVAEDAAAEPLTAGSKGAEKASAWYESVYGTKLEERGQILTKLDELGGTFQAALDAMNAAADRHAQLAAAQDTDPATLQAAEDEWNRLTEEYVEAQTAFEAVYEQYRALPEEKDAWAVGERIEEEYGKD